uniref:Uncharacterized protein n=1 Tax=Candidatus Kentrum sp. DK TaxID=2126562 RepID=A0A450RU27_9GAMM|nr:MAG: hypothetical protein BECKDK2373B_GA0170837_100226 [Candidatus Kentron sp. DK]
MLRGITPTDEKRIGVGWIAARIHREGDVADAHSFTTLRPSPLPLQLWAAGLLFHSNASGQRPNATRSASVFSGLCNISPQHLTQPRECLGLIGERLRSCENSWGVACHPWHPGPANLPGGMTGPVNFHGQGWKKPATSSRQSSRDLVPGTVTGFGCGLGRASASLHLILRVSEFARRVKARRSPRGIVNYFQGLQRGLGAFGGL